MANIQFLSTFSTYNSNYDRIYVFRNGLRNIYECIWIFFHIYWGASVTFGGVIGSLLPINTEGISFVMTAMFVVIFMDQWLKEKNHTSSLRPWFWLSSHWHYYAKSLISRIKKTTRHHYRTLCTWYNDYTFPAFSCISWKPGNS